MQQIRIHSKQKVRHFVEHFCICNEFMVHLRDSLSNPGAPLLRLVTALDSARRRPKLQVGGGAVDELIAQTGVEDPASVRLAVKENRKLSPGEIAEVVAHYETGTSIRSLGVTFGLHEQTVRAHLRRQGVALRPVRVLTATQEDDVVRLYVEEVWSLAEVAAKFEVSAAAIRQVVIRRGIARRSQARRRRY